MADIQEYIKKANEVEKKYGIPQNLLVGLLKTESSFAPNIISGQKRSSAGAIGIAQFMPDTAKEYGIDPTEPMQSIEAAGKYLSKSYKTLGNWDDTIRSYNMGVGGVQEWKKGNKKLSTETANYLPKVYKNAGLDYSNYSGQQTTDYKIQAPKTENVERLSLDDRINTVAYNNTSLPIFSTPAAKETETEEKPKDKDVAELKQQIQERKFLEEYNKQLQERLSQYENANQEQQQSQSQPEYEQQQTPKQNKNYIDIFNRVSEFVDTPIFPQENQQEVAQQGVYIPATSRDSLDLQKYSLRKNQEMLDRGFVLQESDKGNYTNVHNLNSQKKEELKRRFEDKKVTQVINEQGLRVPQAYDHNLYQRPITDYKYYNQETDIGVLDPNSSYLLFDKRVAPTEKRVWMNTNNGDGATTYGYNFGEKYNPPTSTVKKVVPKNKNAFSLTKLDKAANYMQTGGNKANNLYDSWGNMGEDIVYSGTPEYEQAKRDKTFKDVPNQLDEIVESGVVRSNQNTFYKDKNPFFSKSTPIDGRYSKSVVPGGKYEGTHMIEVQGTNEIGNRFSKTHWADASPDPNIFVARDKIGIDNPNLKVYEKDWVKGYKQVGVPKKQQGGIPISKNGMYEYPNQKVIIPSTRITMKDIPHPILAITDKGQKEILEPNKEYQLNGNNTLEIPLTENEKQFLKAYLNGK